MSNQKMQPATPDPALLERVRQSRESRDAMARERRRRLRRGRSLTPADWQEPHAPRQPDVVEEADGSDRRTVLRRKSDSRLWKALDAEQTRAAMALTRTVEALTGPVRPRTARLDGMPPATGAPARESEPERLRRERDLYLAWAERCGSEGVDHTVVIDVMAEGKPLSTVDRERRRRKGWAREMLHAALDIYCVLRGWKRKPQTG